MSYYKSFPKKSTKFFTSLSDKDKLENFLNAVVRINLNNCLTLLSKYSPNKTFLIDQDNNTDCKKDKHIYETTTILDINEPKKMFKLFSSKKIRLKDFFEEFDSNIHPHAKFTDGNQYKGFFIKDNYRKKFFDLLNYYNIKTKDKEIYEWLLVEQSFISVITNYKNIFELIDKMLKLNISKPDENKLLRIKFYLESLNSEDLRNLFLDEKNNNKLINVYNIAKTLPDDLENTYKEDLINSLDILLGIKKYKSISIIETENDHDHVEPLSKKQQDNDKILSRIPKNNSFSFSFSEDPNLNDLNYSTNSSDNYYEDEDLEYLKLNDKNGGHKNKHTSNHKHKRTSKHKHKRTSKHRVNNK